MHSHCWTVTTTCLQVEALKALSELGIVPLEGTGLLAVPGLVDMHVHITGACPGLLSRACVAEDAERTRVPVIISKSLFGPRLQAFQACFEKARSRIEHHVRDVPDCILACCAVRIHSTQIATASRSQIQVPHCLTQHCSTRATLYLSVSKHQSPFAAPCVEPALQVNEKQCVAISRWRR